MADFYVAPTLEFDVPNGHAFYADDAVVIVRPSTNYRFTKSIPLSPIMVRQRHVTG